MDKEVEKSIKLVDSGGYGCIFYPGINCENKLERVKYITKIQMDVDTIRNELRIGKKVRNIQGYARYFAPILKNCKVQLKKDYLQEAKKCEFLQKYSDQRLLEKSYISTKIRYVGKLNLKTYLLGVSPSSFFTEVLRTHSYLLKAVDKLWKNNIVHFDIKHNNIMIDSEKKVPIVIDFGLSFTTDVLQNEREAKNAIYSFDEYSWWCIDVLACAYMLKFIGYRSAKTAMVKKMELNIIYNMFAYGDSSLDAHMEDVFDETNVAPTKKHQIRNFVLSPLSLNSEKAAHYKNTFKTYFSRFLDKPWSHLYKELIKCANTWDNYSLAATYCYLLDRVTAKNPHNNMIANEKHLAYFSTLENILYSAPDERPSIQDTIRQIRV